MLTFPLGVGAAPAAASGSSAARPSRSASARNRVAISSAVVCTITLKSGTVSQTLFARRLIQVATDALAQS